MNAMMRQHTRFVTRQQVEMAVAGQAELRSVWTENISHGGLYVACDDPPPRGSWVDVKLTVDARTILLRAEVVHVMDAAMAASAGMPAGVGLQFGDLSAEVRKRVEDLIAGLHRKKTQEMAVATVAAPTAKEALEAARVLMTHAEENNLYLALGVTPEASAKELASRVTVLSNLLQKPPADATPPQQARLQSAARTLERVSRLMMDPIRRAEFDFRAGNLRVEQRLAEHGGDLSAMLALRTLWTKVLPDRAAAAAGFAQKALQCLQMHDHAGAARNGLAAQEHDPFNAELRRAVVEWRESATKAAAVPVTSPPRAGAPAKPVTPPAPAGPAAAQPGNTKDKPPPH